MAGCQTCDSCQYCVRCQSCNTNCNSSGCNTIQAFCSIGKQTVGSFDFNQCVSSGETVYKFRTNWNRLITYINDAYEAGRKSNGGSSGLPSSDTNEFITAAMFNKISAALGGLGSTGPSRRVKGKSTGDTTEDVIYGSYFEDLESYANNLKYKTSQCDNCNTGCNVTCDRCQKCDSGGCQNHFPSSCCSFCHSGLVSG